MYDALLKKEERVRVCLQNVRRDVAAFYQGKYGKAGSCRTADDCIYEPYGGGFAVNVETYKKYHTCFMTFTDFEGVCWNIVKDEVYTCMNNPAYPCFKAEAPPTPTHYTCENKLCVPRFDGKPRKWGSLYMRYFEGKFWYVDPACRKEFQNFENQLKAYIK